MSKELEIRKITMMADRGWITVDQAMNLIKELRG